VAVREAACERKLFQPLVPAQAGGGQAPAVARPAPATGLPDPGKPPVASIPPQKTLDAPGAPEALQAEAALPTLQDAQALTPASDFQPFMQRGVVPEVRNAAMKKLFADPHFNVMDGLDIYIDDYSQPNPLPAGMLRQMASAQFLKLVPPGEEGAAPVGQEPVAGGVSDQAGQVVAQSPLTSVKAEPQRHDHPDLQLQPDPAPADPPPGPGAG